jgi:hypothetical protein
LDIRLRGIKDLSKGPMCIGTERTRTHLLFYSSLCYFILCYSILCYSILCCSISVKAARRNTLDILSGYIHNANVKLHNDVCINTRVSEARPVHYYLHWSKENVLTLSNHSFTCLSYYRSIAYSKPVLHKERSNASSFNFQCRLLSLSSSSIRLRLLPRLPVTFTFPSVFLFNNVFF